MLEHQRCTNSKHQVGYELPNFEASKVPNFEASSWCTNSYFNSKHELVHL